MKAINNFVWGPVMLVLLMGTGIFLTVRLKFLPWRNLPYALKMVFAKDKNPKHEGDISGFQSLMTALAATIGTGNIVGVSTAMVLGGPGAFLWMWISALFGLSTKYAESVLAVKYRETNENGEMCGGPMYAMKNGFKIKWIGLTLAFLFSVFTVFASFGIGNMTQANSIAESLKNLFQIPSVVTGTVVALLALAILIGGIKSIGKVCGFFVPKMAVFYFVMGLVVIFINRANLGHGIYMIVKMGLSPRAMAGGVGGTIICNMLSASRWGIARGIFSNEAGLGSAPIVAAAARTDHASRQGYINMTGTFFDTLVVCSVTGLVVASSGVLGTVGADGKLVTGAALTIMAFEKALGSAGELIVGLGIMMFAFSTIIGWEYYGEKGMEYLVNKKWVIIIYRIVYCGIVFVGANIELTKVWNFSDTMNGLMAIPNLICLLVLHKDVVKECFDFERIKKGSE
ncbi:MAG: sodium:alanine symporter family protein [Anaerostipes sp.]|nr:sodium:alanine symporter family protein [Anaerostipes sp.]